MKPLTRAGLQDTAHLNAQALKQHEEHMMQICTVIQPGAASVQHTVLERQVQFQPGHTTFPEGQPYS